MRYNRQNYHGSVRERRQVLPIGKPAPAIQPIELASADDTIALQMTRWLTHLRSERRLSPKTLEAYARDLRQCLDFLCQHWGMR